MRKIRTAVAFAASLALAACQTLDGVTVNGVDVSANRVENAQAGGNVCTRNPLICILLGVAVIGGGAWLIWGGDDDDDNDY